jgi:hypothetical protein
VKITSLTTDQKDLIGDVEVSIEVCATDDNDGMGSDDEHPGCSTTGTNSGLPAGGGSMQPLLAFRVPSGTGAPASFGATTTDTGPVTFNRSPSYEAELTSLVPPGAGRVWRGYIGGPGEFDDGADGEAAERLNATVRFSLPRPADGSPYPENFRVGPVAGARGTNAAPGRPVDCGDSPFGPTDGNTTVCIDAPVQAQIDTYFITEVIEDLGIVAGSATLSPGQSVNLPFDARLKGALPAGTTFSVAVRGGIPGVAVAPSVGSFAPQPNSSTRINVPVAIPKTAGPGTYPISVTAALPNGQQRTGTAQVTIRDRQAPVASKAKVRPKKFRPSKRKRRGANLTYTLSEAGTVKVTFQRCAKKRRGKCRKYKTRKGSLAARAVAGTNRIHLTGYLRRRKLPRGTYRLAITPTDLAGNRGKVARAAFAIKK